MRNMSVIVALLLVFSVASGVLAEEKERAVGPCLVTLFIGPRAGIEMNEDRPIQMWELVHAFGISPARAVASWMLGGEAAGVEGCIVSFCIGPRVGAQLPERRVRTKEWTRLIPIYGIIPTIQIALEAYNGKTMTEIAEQEGLSKK